MSPAGALRIIPLGGLGEFGLNCTVLESGEDLLVLDAGLMFPTEDFLGVEIVVPDMSYIAERRDRVRGVVLTHGHEDHIGAVPFLAPLVSCPIYGSPLTIGFTADRLRDNRPGHRAELVAVRDRESISAGPFEVEFLPVTHSIPDAFALAIRTPAGTILHTSDFKLDPTPVDGRLTDMERIGHLGDEGVRLMLLDSTNAPVRGATPSEREVGRNLSRIFREAQGRIFVTCFASNIHRVQQIIDLAASHGRKVALAGRSLNQAAETAISLGRLGMPPGARVESRRVMDLPAREAVVIASGSQGEPLSAMMRIALDEHAEISLERGDIVIVSSRAIPGNEMSVARMLDHLYRRGADVVSGPDGAFHVSGHASQDDLKEMLLLARPETVIPVHGSYRHLAECARVAEDLPSPPRQVLVAETGDIIELDGGRARLAGRAPVGRVHIDEELEEVEEIVLRDRRRLSADGIVLPVLLLDRADGTLASPPVVVSRGFSPLEGKAKLQQEVGGVVASTVQAAGKEAAGDRNVIKSKVAADLKRFLRNRTGRRPLILPVIVEV